MQNIQELSIRAVIFKEFDRHVAQCVDYDICASAVSITELMKVFERRIIGNIAVNIQMGRHGLDGFDAPPDKFAEMFERANLDISSRFHVVPTESAPKAHFRLLEAV